MSITKEKKQELIGEFATKQGDTGSIEVQCAVLTERIKNLTEHLKGHNKDFSSRNGLMVLVARRKRLLKYLEKKDANRYFNLTKVLGLKGNK
ncbi:MAG: 30S ribosomal protein S15 [Rickettsiales bacterium]|nr:30S ribosomal protein S15 [Rickettsiales bacterium]